MYPLTLTCHVDDFISDAGMGPIESQYEKDMDNETELKFAVK